MERLKHVCVRLCRGQKRVCVVDAAPLAASFASPRRQIPSREVEDRPPAARQRGAEGRWSDVPGVDLFCREREDPPLPFLLSLSSASCLVEPWTVMSDRLACGHGVGVAVNSGST